MTSPAQTPGQAATRQQRPDPRTYPHVKRPGAGNGSANPVGPADRFRAAGLPWFGLDGGWLGSRRTGDLCTDPDGTVRYGTLEHGDAPAGRPGGDPSAARSRSSPWPRCPAAQSCAETVRRDPE